jgi:hypothetical protein
MGFFLERGFVQFPGMLCDVGLCLSLSLSFDASGLSLLFIFVPFFALR